MSLGKFVVDLLKNSAKDNLKGLVRGGGSPTEVARQTRLARQQRRASEQLVRTLGDAARRGYRKSLAQGRRDIQYVDGDVKVKVKNGYDVSADAFTTDVVVIPRKNNPHGSHWHSVFDEHGNAFIDKWREK